VPVDLPIRFPFRSVKYVHQYRLLLRRNIVAISAMGSILGSNG